MHPSSFLCVLAFLGLDGAANAVPSERGESGTAAASPAERTASLPNVVIILADDLGWGDVRCYGGDRSRIPTPRIDGLASQGMRFTDAHSSSGVCSPSRYSILTGRYHWRTRLQRGIVGLWEEPLIAADRPTIASLARGKGYRTACVGKWHLGWDWPIPPARARLFRGFGGQAGGGGEVTTVATDEHRAVWRETFSLPIPGGPTERGFEEYFGTDVPNWPPYCFIDGDRTVGVPSELLPAELLRTNLASIQGPALPGWKLEAILPELADRAAAWVERRARAGEPFLLYLPLTSPHTPLSPTSGWVGKSGLNVYADLVMQTDAVVGRVLDAVEAGGAADRTLVVFTSDNGCAPYIGAKDLEARGHFPSGPFRGYKGDAWEGGHRVPFIVRWPGKVAAGSTCSRTICSVDLLATIAEAIGADVPPGAGEDSVSLLPLLRGEDRRIHDLVVHHSAAGVFAVREGAWKLILGPGAGAQPAGSDVRPLLHDLSADPGETTDVANRNPEVVRRLTAGLERLVADGRSTPGPAARNDVPVRVGGAVRRLEGGLLRERLLLPGWDPEEPVPAIAVYPEGKLRLPLVFLFHWLQGTKEAMEPWARELAPAGLFVVAPDLHLHGERRVEGLFSRPDLPALGEEVSVFVHQDSIAHSARDFPFLIESLARRPEVDAERVGVAGISMGGSLALVLGSREERIDAAASLVGAADFWWDVTKLPPGPAQDAKRATYGDRVRRLVSSIDPWARLDGFAPKAILVASGRGDGYIAIDSMRRFAADLGRRYAAFPERLSFLEEDVGHEATESMRRAANAWFARHLPGPGGPRQP